MSGISESEFRKVAAPDVRGVVYEYSIAKNVFKNRETTAQFTHREQMYGKAYEVDAAVAFIDLGRMGEKLNNPSPPPIKFATKADLQNFRVDGKNIYALIKNHTSPENLLKKVKEVRAQLAEINQARAGLINDQLDSLESKKKLAFGVLLTLLALLIVLIAIYGNKLDFTPKDYLAIGGGVAIATHYAVCWIKKNTEIPLKQIEQEVDAGIEANRTAMNERLDSIEKFVKNGE